MAQAQVREAVGGVVFAWRGEGQQAAAGAGDGDQSSVKDRDAENQDGHQPRVRELRPVRADFQAERGHQETEKHRAAIAHENFGGIEIPAQETERGAESGSAEGADESLTAHRGGNGEEAGGDGGDAGAEAVHVIENAEGGGDADDPDDGEAPIEREAGDAGNELRKKLRADAGSDQENGGDRHADEEFDLMVEQAAVVKEADDGEQGGSGEDADDLLLGDAVAGEENREHEAEVNRGAAQERNRIDVDFPRAGLVHHAVAEGQVADGDGERERGQQGHGEGDNFGVIGEDGHGVCRVRLVDARCVLYDGRELFQLVHSSIFGGGFPGATAHIGEARGVAAKFADGGGDGGGIVGVGG